MPHSSGFHQSSGKTANYCVYPDQLRDINTQMDYMVKEMNRINRDLVLVNLTLSPFRIISRTRLNIVEFNLLQDANTCKILGDKLSCVARLYEYCDNKVAGENKELSFSEQAELFLDLCNVNSSGVASILGNTLYESIFYPEGFSVGTDKEKHNLKLFFVDDSGFSLIHGHTDSSIGFLGFNPWGILDKEEDFDFFNIDPKFTGGKIGLGISLFEYKNTDLQWGNEWLGFRRERELTVGEVEATAQRTGFKLETEIKGSLLDVEENDVFRFLGFEIYLTGDFCVGIDKDDKIALYDFFDIDREENQAYVSLPIGKGVYGGSVKFGVDYSYYVDKIDNIEKDVMKNVYSILREE